MRVYQHNLQDKKEPWIMLCCAVLGLSLENMDIIHVYMHMHRDEEAMVANINLNQQTI
jgi:hypothetical protein